MNVSEILIYAQSNPEQILMVIAAVLGVAAQIAQFTPNQSDDKIVNKLLGLVNFLGGNNLKAKNNPKIK